MSELLDYQLDDGIATVTFDDGKANAMSVAMLGAIAAAFDRAATDDAAIVLRGRPGFFSGGFDLSVFKRDRQELFDMLMAGAHLTERLIRFPRPVVAVCTGHAIAMGAFLLLGADVRIGSDAAAKVQVNEVKIGLTLPHFAVELCRQRLAPAHFSLACVTATPYTQAQAVTAGFLDEVVAAADLAATLEARKAHLRSLDREAFTATKARVREPAATLLHAAIAEDRRGWSARFGVV